MSLYDQYRQRADALSGNRFRYIGGEAQAAPNPYLGFGTGTSNLPMLSPAKAIRHPMMVGIRKYVQSNASQADLMVMDGETPRDNERTRAFMNAIGLMHGRRALLTKWSADMLIHETAYGIPIFDGFDMIGVRYESPVFFHPIYRNGTQEIIGYRNNGESHNPFSDDTDPPQAGRPGDYFPEDVIHLVAGIDDRRVFEGSSPFLSAIPVLSFDQEIENFMSSGVYNKAAPGLVLAPTKDLGGRGIDQQTLDMLIEQFRLQSTGANRGKTAILSSFLEVVSKAASMGELNITDMGKWTETRMASIYGISTQTLGLLTGEEYANTRSEAETNRRDVLESVMLPIWDILSEQIDNKIYKRYFVLSGSRGVGTVMFDLNSVPALQPDRRVETQIQAALWKAGLKTRNEARVALGEEEVDGGDVFIEELETEVPSDDVSGLTLNSDGDNN